MGTLQGYQSTPNGSFAGFQEPELPEHSIGFQQMQPHPAAGEYKNIIRHIVIPVS
jgi:hypothetical protein